MKKDTNKYPKDWNAKKVRDVISHYNAQSVDESIAEADAAWENSSTSLVRVPNALVAEVEALIAKRVTKPKPAHRRKAS